MGEVITSNGRLRKLTNEEIEAYDLVPSELSSRVWLVRIASLPGPYVGMSLGRFLLLAKPVPDNGSSLLLAHELVHVRQWMELGVAGFTYRYLRDFVGGLRRYRRWDLAYRQIEAEKEARFLADQWLERRSLPPAGAS